MIGRETLSHRPIICCLNFDQPPLPTFCIPPFTCQLLRCARLGMLCRLAFVNTSPFLKAAIAWFLETSTQKNAMKCACCSKLQIAAPKQSTASSAFSLNQELILYIGGRPSDGPPAARPCLRAFLRSIHPLDSLLRTWSANVKAECCVRVWR